MLENVKVLFHSSILINDDIYIDPFNIQDEKHNANLIFITHSHFDHFSPEDINKISNENTKIICTKDVKEKLKGFTDENILVVLPNVDYVVNGIEFKTIPAYNIIKPFHPKHNNWVGYVIKINNESIYITGDTDATEDAKNVKCDILLLPIGGTYTMNYKDAAKLTNTIKPKAVIPTHYNNNVVGTKDISQDFIELLDKDIEYRIDL